MSELPVAVDDRDGDSPECAARLVREQWGALAMITAVAIQNPPLGIETFATKGSLGQ